MSDVIVLIRNLHLIFEYLMYRMAEKVVEVVVIIISALFNVKVGTLINTCLNECRVNNLINLIIFNLISYGVNQSLVCQQSLVKFFFY